jgi:predicted nucleotidyltransferase
MAATLEVLAGAEQSFSGREVARMAPYGSVAGVLHALDRLVEHGLATREVRSGMHLYRLNRDHILADAVSAIVHAQLDLVSRLREAIRSWPVRPVHASLFGSAARRDGDTTSDLDILVVHHADTDPEDSRWRRQLDELAADAHRWTGNAVAYVVLSEDELAAAVERNERIVESWREDGIHLGGARQQRLLR